MREFLQKRRFKAGLLLGNYVLCLIMYIFTDLFTTELILTWGAFVCIMQCGFYMDSRAKDYSTRITSVCLGMMLPVTAAIDPKSLYIVECFIIPALCSLYILGEAEHIDFTFWGVSVVSWAVCWMLNSEVFCADLENEKRSCPRAYGLVIQLFVSGIMSFNQHRHAKHINSLIQQQKEDRLVIEAHLKTQEKLNAELKKTMEMNDNFLMAFSHELKNPLNALLGSIELALDEIVCEEVRFLLTNAQMSGRMLLHLLTNILDSGKIQLNKLDVNPQAGNFIAYLENFWHTASMLIKPKGLHGFLSIGKNFPTRVLFDSHRISQILLNLLSNSLKFTEKGQIRINCSFEKGNELLLQQFESKFLPGLTSTEDEEMFQGDKNNPRNTIEKRNPLNLTILPQVQQLTITTDDTKDNEKFQLDLQRKVFPPSFFKRQNKSKEGYLRIEIVDTGCGMNPQQVSRLFQKFSQVNENTTKRQIGTGLGLWITKELCEMMKGDIKVSSIEEVGTSFVFLIKTQSFPDEVPKSYSKKFTNVNAHLNFDYEVSSSSFSEQGREDSVQNRSSSMDFKRLRPITFTTTTQKKALIAEDLSYNQEIYKRMLKKEGIEVIIANDGAEAVKVFKGSPPRSFQFLLFDLNMPNLDGISASKEIREFETARGLKSTPIIIATGHCSQETRQVCLDRQGSVRAFDVMIKPVMQANLAKICELTKK
mgnify:FL=1